MSGNDPTNLSQLNSKKEHKLTRRRVVELATSAGISTAVAANMTVDDVKAADSDQVTISLDCRGNRKYTTAADYLEWCQRAKRATDHITEAHFDKEGVLSVGMNGGKSQDNPHVVVTIDKNSNKKEERRGEIPEEQNGVRVETRERENNIRLACNTDCVDSSKNFPGGQHIDIDDYTGRCTSSSQVLDTSYDFVGWSTAGHCFPSCNSDNRDMYHCPDDDSCAIYIVGTTDHQGFIDPYRDVGFISYDQEWDVSPSSWNLKPSNHGEGVYISGTLSEEGMQTLLNEYSGEQKFFSYGAGSCHTSGELTEMYQTRDISDQPGRCRDELRDQIFVDFPCYSDETITQGDSGSLWFTPDPNTDTWYAAGSLTAYSGITFCGVDRGYGAQGFTLDNRHGLAWRG